MPAKHFFICWILKSPACETGLFFCLKSINNLSTMLKEIHWSWKKFSDLTLEELYSIIQVRETVFVVEQKLSYVDCDDFDQKAWHLMGFRQGKLVAYLRTFPAGAKYPEHSFGRVLTLQEARGYGLGKELVARGLKKIQENFGPGPVVISAQSYLEKFYAAFGFATVSEAYLEEGIPHLRMKTT
jgi:ElaA protein